MLFVSELGLDDRAGKGRGPDDVPDSLEPELPMPSVLLRLHPTKVTTNAVAAIKCFFIFNSFVCVPPGWPSLHPCRRHENLEVKGD